MISFFLWVRRNEGRMKERCLGAGRGNVCQLAKYFYFASDAMIAAFSKEKLNI